MQAIHEEMPSGGNATSSEPLLREEKSVKGCLNPVSGLIQSDDFDILARLRFAGGRRTEQTRGCKPHASHANGVYYQYLIQFEMTV